MNVLVLGATGMLGNAVSRVFSMDSNFNVFATTRQQANASQIPSGSKINLVSNVDVEQFDSLVKAIEKSQPELIINCIGLVKQLDVANDPLSALPINSVLPHRLAMLCGAAKARLIHVSTDCVFSGSAGNYLESDFPNATDLYGRSKLLGEVIDKKNSITLRTSIIGHELSGSRSLLNWFLSQSGSVNGFTKAIFSGLPTVELATVMKDWVVPNTELHGLYHVSSAPIDKYSLLQLIAKQYGKQVEINPNDSLVIDRSLNSDRFKLSTGYVAPSWAELVKRMHSFG